MDKKSKKATNPKPAENSAEKGKENAPSSSTATTNAIPSPSEDISSISHRSWRNHPDLQGIELDLPAFRQGKRKGKSKPSKKTVAVQEVASKDSEDVLGILKKIKTDFEVTEMDFRDDDEQPQQTKPPVPPVKATPEAPTITAPSPPLTVSVAPKIQRPIKAKPETTSPPKTQEIAASAYKADKPKILQSVTSHLNINANRKKDLNWKKTKEYKERIIELSRKKAGDMFGINSKLGATNDMLFYADKMHSTDDDTRSLNSGDSSGPDKSWILDWSGDDDKEDDMSDYSAENYPKPVWTELSESTNAAFSPLFTFMTLCGRLPFSGGLSSRHEIVEFSYPKNTIKFWAFCVTSFIFMFLLTVMIHATFNIYSENGASNGAYKKLETLYLEKYWLQVSMFMALLFFLTVCSLIMLFQGKMITTWLNSIIYQINSKEIEITKWIWVYGTAHLCCLGMYFIYMVIVYNTEASPGIRGGTYAITVLLFHFLGGIRVKVILFQHLANCILVLQMYVILCAHICILFPMLCSMLVRNMAVHRNVRLGLILGAIKSNCYEVEKLKKSLTFQNVFEFNKLTNRALRQFCECFKHEICLYYLIQCWIICLCFYKIAKSAGVTFYPEEKSEDFTDTAVRDSKNRPIETYKDTIESTIYDAFFYLGTTIFSFIAITKTFADCTSMFVSGINFIRNCSLVKCKGSKGRRFILSLDESFSSVNPYVISPGSFFEIDRRFIIRILEWSAFVFMILIQTQSNPLIKHPIWGICRDGIENQQRACVIGHSVSKIKQTFGPTKREIEKIINPTVLPPPISQEKYAPYSFAQFAEYCPGTDIVRMIGFNELFQQIPLPEDRFECIAQPYKRDVVYYDAFGQKVDKRDDCGFPRFPLMSSYRDVSKPPVYPNSTRFEGTSNGKTPEFDCWDFQPGGTVGVDIFKENSKSRYKCGFPVEYAVIFCSAHKLSTTLNVVKGEVNRQLELEGRTSDSGFPKCTEENFNSDSITFEIANATKFAQPFLVTPFFFINLANSQVTFIPYTREGRPWPFRVDNLKYEVAPYTSTSISSSDKPGLYFDCTGKLLPSFDDAGFLPFPYLDNDKFASPTLTPTEVSLEGFKANINCYEIKWLGEVWKCGVNSVKADFTSNVVRRITNWLKVHHSKHSKHLIGMD